MGLRVLMLNLNNLEYTKQSISDLSSQNIDDFKITIVDQGSNEAGTVEDLEGLCDKIDVVFNSKNEPVNKMWNWFYQNYNEELLCFLNNDVRIPHNFISDTMKVFKKEDKVGIAVHATNHPNYSKILDKLEYTKVPKFINMQGWDYTIRRDAFSLIPNEIKIYCGDDFLYNHLYEKGWDMVYITSSPIIHYEGQSKKFMVTNGMEDIWMFKKLGFKHYLKINPNYSKIKPTFKTFIK